ncbi:MAG TPA: hypothetical protein VMJ75_22590 [Candidatus Acidoferrales bacterium]|nr:hypothetical protein [Candidatus Acidoferrales bacterium]
MIPLVHAEIAKPAAWVPARWPWADARSLDLLDGSPVNCLLLKSPPAEFVAAAKARGVVVLAIGGDPDDLVLTGEPGLPTIHLTTRRKMALGSGDPIIGTTQGVWPGIAPEEAGAHKAGPTSSVWIDTNTGFLRAVRAWGPATVWIANMPPEKTVITTARYLQAIADAAIIGARWVIALDSDLAARLDRREEAAMGTWKRMGALLDYFEHHPEWRTMREAGQLAIVQDPAKGGLLSGGILDMIATKHTPVRPVPSERLTPEALAGATMAVNIAGDSLNPEQKEVLRGFARGGGTLLNGPPGWKDPAPAGGAITLEKPELERLGDMWRDVNGMIGRRNLGVRLFNVASMLSNYVSAPGGKSAIVQLVNYSDYPVDNVTLHYLAELPRATLITPEGAEKKLEVYKTEDGWGVDIDRVSTCAAIRLEQ